MFVRMHDNILSIFKKVNLHVVDGIGPIFSRTNHISKNTICNTQYKTKLMGLN